MELMCRWYIQYKCQTNVIYYTKTQLIKMVIEIDIRILPFYKGVRGIIVKYLQ